MGIWGYVIPMRRLFFILLALASVTLPLSAQAGGRQQINHPNNLCDDYIRLKLQEYLDNTERANYDDYMVYKQQLIDYCDESTRNNTPIPDSSGTALDAYNRSLD